MVAAMSVLQGPQDSWETATLRDGAVERRTALQELLKLSCEDAACSSGTGCRQAEGVLWQSQDEQASAGNWQATPPPPGADAPAPGRSGLTFRTGEHSRG
ncbi:unnamed protein product [Lepidochelys kempii]